MGGTLSCTSAPSRTTDSETPALLFSELVLKEIFLKLPYTHVVCVCRLVCHQWKEVADSQSLWKEKCKQDGYRPCGDTKIPSDWRVFYTLCQKKRNLLKNPCGEDQLKGWQMLGGGQKWQVTELLQPHRNEKVKTNFVTSYGQCRKMQMIDLKKEGYSSSFMDEIQPAIRVSDWFAALWDCVNEYTVLVQLLNIRNKVMTEYRPNPIHMDTCFNEQWNEVTHTFQDYGPGVRYILIIHGGSVRRFWNVQCGLQITNTCIEICPALNT